MPKFPIYLDMSGRRVVVIGAGSATVQKVQALRDAGARITVIAERIHPSFSDALGAANVELILSLYSKSYLVGATLVIAMTHDPVLNKQVYRDCQELQILCCVEDEPQLCDFYIPAVVKRGDLHIAIGTDGNCPAYAGHVRQKLQSVFTESHGRFVEELEKMRREILKRISDSDQRKVLLGRLASDDSFNLFDHEGVQAWNEFALTQMNNCATA